MSRNKKVFLDFSTAILVVMLTMIVCNLFAINNLAYAESENSLTRTSININVASSVSIAETCMVDVISGRDNATNISYTQNGSASWYVQSNNYSQTMYNNFYALSHENEQISGTCSLIAAMNVIYTSRAITGINSFNLTTFDIFYRLYDISITYGNTYPSNRGLRGTIGSTLPGIVSDFYSTYGINRNVIRAQYTNSVNGSTALSVNKLSMLSFSGYRRYHNASEYEDNDGDHCVVYNGLYAYKVSYKSKPWYALWGVNHKNEDFYMYRIANGWDNSTAQTFGGAYSLLVFKDNASFYDTYIEGLI